ncbi:MAG: neutral/alkaline non-lysosomal ceramidase N-terminal domain-containing protein [Planctomycetaceae bacterium]|nr:neutral/alkaline non-lysosomal ceramidase N-terminal domain-containing protein [Planctomycetaceae bacterium]
MRLFCSTAAVLAVLVGTSAPLACQADDGWRAGVATTVITPEHPMWMSGYASRDHAAEGTLHDLRAKALVLEDPTGHQGVLVTLDLIGIDRPTSLDICQQLHDRFGFERDQIVLATSHTHTGPAIGENLSSMFFFEDDERAKVQDYTNHLKGLVVDVVGLALKNRKPAVIHQGMGTAGFAVNRRNNREADVPQLREAGELKGPVDHELPVLTVRDADGHLDAIVFGYACHATVLSFYQWSGDWPGFAQLEIESRHPGTVAMFWAGCGADQNPLPRRTIDRAEDYGRQIAEGIDAVLSGEMTEVQGPLKTSYTEIDLAFDRLPTQEQLQSDTESDNRYVASRARQLLDQWKQDGGLSQTYPYPVQVWGLGDDVTFVTLGGEVVVDFSIRIKQELEAERTWVAGYANDVMAYIPSERVLTEGGYEGGGAMVYYGLPTAWSPDVEEHIIRTVHELVDALSTHSQSSSNSRQ